MNLRRAMALLPWKKRTAHYKRGLLLQWHITERCGQRCAHCYQDSYGGAGELPLAALLDILGQYKTLLEDIGGTDGGVPRGHITLAGGEPFAREDVWDLLEAISREAGSLSFGLLTNGSFLDGPSIRKLRGLNPRFAQVSLDGDRETHDNIRGDGDYDRVLGVIGALMAEGIFTMISFTAGAGNYRQFPHVARLGRALGVGKVWTDRMIPLGHGAAMAPMDKAMTAEYIKIVAEEKRLAEDSFFSRTEVAADRALQFLGAGGKPYRCRAGESLITIMPDGTLYPCRRMPINCGNVMEAPLARLYHGGALMKSLRDRGRIPEGCQGCSYARFCSGGLRCMSSAACGDPFRADPGCTLAGERKEMSFIL